MNELYELSDLLKFWQRQLKDGFAVVEALARLMDSPYLSDEDKHHVVLETLHKYGLFEITYEGDRTFIEKSRELHLPEEEVQLPDYDENYVGDETIIPLEFYNVNMLNAIVEFKSIMN